MVDVDVQIQIQGGDIKFGILTFKFGSCRTVVTDLLVQVLWDCILRSGLSILGDPYL